MKNFTKILSIALFFAGVMLSSQDAKASHFKGGDIYFQCIGNGQYRLVFTCYYSCEASSSAPYDPSSFTFTLTNNCGSTTIPTSITASDVYSQAINDTLPLYCPGIKTTCTYYNGGLGTIPPGTPDGTLYRNYITAPFTIPPGCTVTAEMDVSARNSAITNLATVGADLDIAATLTTPASGNCQDNPEFAAYPVNVFCMNQNVNFSQGAVDLSGDSLVYSLINPRTFGGTPIPFQSGCTATNPFGAPSVYASTFSFDTHTGNVNFTPTQSGNFVFAVQVDAYHNGVLVSSTMRDIQLVVVNCAINPIYQSSPPPFLTNFFDPAHVTGGVVYDSTNIGVCPGSPLRFVLKATSADSFAYVKDSAAFSQILPGSTYTVTHTGGVHDTSTLTVNWIPTNADSGFHYLYLTVSDTNCPKPAKQVYAFTISVLNGLYAGPNLVYCNGGQPVTIQAHGATHYEWTDSATGGAPIGVVGYNSDSSAIIVGPPVPNSTVGYVVHGDLIGGCKNYDTVMVRNVPKFNLSVTAADSSICKYTSTTLTATAVPASVGPYTYQWTPANLVQSPTAATTAITPLRNSGWYHVLVSAIGGCVIGDSVPVNIEGSAPRITITPSNNNVCPGDTVTLNGQGFAENVVECGLVDSLWTNSYLDLRTVGNDNVSSVSGTPYNGTYPAARAQYLVRASEMNAAGLTSGTITDISFFVTQMASTVPYDSLRVSIGCTSQDSLTTFVTGLQEVTFPTSFVTNTGWSQHPFTQHFFNWDGYSNIVIQICYTRNSTSFNNSDYVATSTTSYYGSSIYDVDFGSGLQGCSLNSFPTILNTRPNIRIGMSVPDVMTYQWSPSTLVCDTCPQTAVIVNADSTYHLTVHNNSCVNDTIIRVTTNKNIGINAVPDTTLCGLDTVQLDVLLTNAPPAVCLQDYVVQSIPYAAISGVGTAVPTSSFLDAFGFNNTDDGTAGPFNIPFNFPFYCQSYNRFYINSNGWMSFVNPYPNATGSLQYVAQSFPPSSAFQYPMHEIALMVGDYEVNNGNVTYFMSGTAPNRTMVIKYTNLQSLSGIGQTTGEIHLHETSGVIDIMLLSSTYSANHTTGIKDSTGIGVAAPGRNNSTYVVSSAEGWRFTPMNGSTVALGNTVWTPATSISNTNIHNPLAWPTTPQTYYVDEYLTINQFTNPTTCHVRDSVHIDVTTFGHSVTAAPVTICPGDTSRLTFTSGHAISSYAWTPASFLDNAASGTPLAQVYDTTKFYVIAIDANGCRGLDSVTVNVVPTPRVHVNSSATICYTDSAQLSVSGTYSNYQWFVLDTTQGSGRDTLGTTSTQVAHPRGLYLVRVMAAGSSCYYYSDTATIDSFAHPRLHVTSSGPDSFCIGGNVVLETDQGYSNYVWTPAGGSASAVPVTSSGVYSYTALDANGCHLFSDTTHVVVSNPPAINFAPYKNPICSNEVDTITVTTNPLGYPVVWMQGVTQVASGNTFVATGPGTYDVIASVGCPTDSQFVLSSAPSPTVQLDSASTFSACGCTPIPVTASATPASASDTYVWTADQSTGATYNIDSSGTYTVVLTDVNNCTASTSITATLSCPQIFLDALKDTVFAADTNRLSVTPVGSAVLTTYAWTPAANVVSPTEASTGATTQHTGLDTFYVTVTDNNGCTNTKFITYVVIEPGIYRMPSAFTPNGDGKNEHFYPVLNGPGSTARVTAFRVYNRWGQLVYDNPASPGWDGAFGGNAQASDTYTYFVTVETPDPADASKTKQSSAEGNFQLFR